jgi:hypothetical protein
MEQLPVPVTQADRVLTPVELVLDELEGTADQRMERVRHPHQVARSPAQAAGAAG